MRKIIFMLLLVTMVSCVNVKEVALKEKEVHFALQDHTFEETCMYFDSCYKAKNLKQINVAENK